MRPKRFLAFMGVRQQDLSKRCRKQAKEMGLPERGYSQSRLSRIINNRIVPREHEKKVIERALGADDLIDW
jgi:hypothetical protein